jgi:hypothetical protein
MRKLILIFGLLFSAIPAIASAPICLYQDVLSGPASGGEGSGGGDGIYLSIYGLNFGSSRGTSTVTINGVAPAQYIYWGTDPTGERQQVGVQISRSTTGTGNVVITTSAGSSSCPNTFTVRSGHIWFLGSGNDTNTTTLGTCSYVLKGIDHTNANSYTNPWGLDLTDGPNVPDGAGYQSYRTPFTYVACVAAGDVIEVLNGVNWPYYDGRSWHASLTIVSTTSSTSFLTFQARPGAVAQFGPVTQTGGADTGYSIKGTVDITSGGYTVYAGLGFSGSELGGIAMQLQTPGTDHDRVIGNTIQCASCDGSAAALGAGDFTTSGSEILGNWITNVGTTTGGTGDTNKEFHDVYIAGSNFEFAWNRISNPSSADGYAFNGVQVHHDGASGFYNFSIHDNDIADVNGSGINLSAIDPASGYVSVYNNIIHHTGIAYADGGSGNDPHSCIAIKGYGTATGAGTVEIYNNTMYDCSSVLATHNSDQMACAIVVMKIVQTSVTTNLVNNVVYQPNYGAGTGYQNVYICAGGTPLGLISGSHNIFYSAATPGSTTPPTGAGLTSLTIPTDPLYVSATNGPWTNYELQATSPAIGAGLQVGPVYTSVGTSVNPLSWDFQQNTRPNPPAIGALEYQSGGGSVGGGNPFLLVIPN